MYTSVPGDCFVSAKQCRPRWNAAFCGISSGSSLFVKVTVKRFQAYKSVKKGNKISWIWSIFEILPGIKATFSIIFYPNMSKTTNVYFYCKCNKHDLWRLLCRNDPPSLTLSYLLKVLALIYFAFYHVDCCSWKYSFFLCLFQCFDLESYLQLNCERGQWRCPVCK